MLPNGSLMDKSYNTLGHTLEVTLLNLRLNTDYAVSIAGVTRAGIGVFSLPLALITAGGKQK